MCGRWGYPEPTAFLTVVIRAVLLWVDGVSRTAVRVTISRLVRPKSKKSDLPAHRSFFENRLGLGCGLAMARWRVAAQPDKCARNFETPPMFPLSSLLQRDRDNGRIRPAGPHQRNHPRSCRPGLPDPAMAAWQRSVLLAPRKARVADPRERRVQTEVHVVCGIRLRGRAAACRHARGLQVGPADRTPGSPAMFGQTVVHLDGSPRR